MAVPSNPGSPPPPWPPQAAGIPPTSPRRDIAARWLAAIGVLVGVAGLCVGVIAISVTPRQTDATSDVDPSASQVAAFTPEEVAAAKAKLCAAHKFVSDSVSNANAFRETNGDPGLENAYVAIANVSLVGGAAYLERHLDPAAPAEIQEMVELLIDKYLTVAVGGVGGGNPQYESDIAEANVTSKEVERLCQ